MKNKSSRNLLYAITAFILLSIFWSVPSHFFTSFKLNHFNTQLPCLMITTSLTWSLVIAKLRKNEITYSSTQELILYMISFPVISSFAAFLVKMFNPSFSVQIIPFILCSSLIAAVTWLLLRLHETFEFSFGRRIKIHSKLTNEQYAIICKSLVDTRLEKYIDLNREKKDLSEYDLLIVSNISEIDEEIISAHLAGTKIESFDNFLISLKGKISSDVMKISADYFSLKRIGFMAIVYQNIKTFLEPITALIMGIALLPVMLIIGLIVRLTSKGPAIFKQVRTGHNGKLFTLYKFRTMTTDAEKNGPKWWTPEDNRVTSIGKILRATHMDELPQLLNVILGDMGFVGPRPELPEFYESLGKDIPSFHLRTLIKPGITGWAQIKGGYANSIESSKNKLEFDLYYIFNLSLLLDLQIVVDTLTGNKVKSENTAENSILVSTEGKNV